MKMRNASDMHRSCGGATAKSFKITVPYRGSRATVVDLMTATRDSKTPLASCHCRAKQ